MTIETAKESPRIGEGRSPFSIVKDEVSVARYLSDRGVEVKNGRARCPIHDGDNPQALAVYPDTGRWHCFRGCGSGDVLDLYLAVEGGSEPWEAMIALSLRYDVELPGRPDRWHQHQDDKAVMREEMRKGLTKVYQRRLYRMLHDAGSHPEDDAALWDAMYPTAYLAATRRVFG